MDRTSRGSIRVVHVADDEPTDHVVSGLRESSGRIGSVTTLDPTAARATLASDPADADCVFYRCPDATALAFVEEFTDLVPDLPVVVYVGEHAPRLAADAFEAGAADVAWVPPGSDPGSELAARIHRAVARADLERRSRETDRINSLVRSIVRRLVDASTVAAVEREVCESFAAADPYAFAWVGEPDPETGEIRPRTCAGGAAAYLSDVTILYDEERPEGRGPGGRAVRTRETQVVQHMPQDLSFTPWQERADEYGFRSLIALPLVVDESFHGILTIYADRPHAFDETERTVLEELTEIIGRAIAAVRTKQELAERERELARQNERLDEFASILAHDLRNPLQVAQARLGMLDPAAVAERGDGAQADREDHVAAIERAHDRIETLIDDLLVLAREGESTTDVEPLALPEVVEDCWRNVETADATCVTEAEGVAEADETQLKRAIENLARNAVEHAGPDVTVRVGDLSDGFFVEDDGPGIPPAERERVFEAGYADAGKGTGLGLAIVEQVARNHGWEVTLCAGTDGGARFEFTGVATR